MSLLPTPRPRAWRQAMHTLHIFVRRQTIAQQLREEVHHALEEGLPTAYPLRLLPYTRLVHAAVLRLYPPTCVKPLEAVTPSGCRLRPRL